jgi:hypothetical protein
MQENAGGGRSSCMQEFFCGDGQIFPACRIPASNGGGVDESFESGRDVGQKIIRRSYLPSEVL